MATSMLVGTVLQNAIDWGLKGGPPKAGLGGPLDEYGEPTQLALNPVLGLFSPFGGVINVRTSKSIEREEYFRKKAEAQARFDAWMAAWWAKNGEAYLRAQEEKRRKAEEAEMAKLKILEDERAKEFDQLEKGLLEQQARTIRRASDKTTAQRRLESQQALEQQRILAEQEARQEAINRQMEALQKVSEEDSMKQAEARQRVIEGQREALTQQTDQQRAELEKLQGVTAEQQRYMAEQAALQARLLGTAAQSEARNKALVMSAQSAPAVQRTRAPVRVVSTSAYRTRRGSGKKKVKFSQ